MTLIIRGFLAVGDMAFSDPFAAVLDSPNRRFLENLCMFVFKDAAVTKGYIITSCRISASVLAVVFFLAPVTTFLGGVVPGGSLAAARFGHK